MKKILFFMYFFVFLSFQGKSQENWLCVYPDKKVYFEDRHKEVYTIRIDSTFNDNTILYPFSDLHYVGEGCYSITSGSWLAKYIVIDEDRNTTFINGKTQPIFIKSQGSLNEIWDVFENENIKVKGKITSIDLKSVLGVEDSVKTISFSVYNTNDILVNHALNQLSIEASKTFGLVKILNFYYFEHSNEFNLIGISEPQLGFQPKNLREQYFDFQVGDELHILDSYTSMGYWYERKIINRYLSRTNYNDSIVYAYESKVYSRYSLYGQVSTSTTTEIYKQKINKGLFFHTEPNEPIFDGYGVSKAMIGNSLWQGMYFGDSNLSWNDDTSCFNFNTAADVCGTTGLYYPGLGGPYFGCCDLWEDRYCYDLVYWKKGDVTFGTPFDFEVSIPEVENDVYSFNIFPNPAGDYIAIKSANNETFNDGILEIYDIFGRKHLSKQIDNSEFIDISSLISGHYIVRLIQKNKDVIYNKMIKQ